MELDAIDIPSFMPLAKKVAAKVCGECGGLWRLDELESEAMVGLMKARNAFDSERGEFGAFAAHKIRFHLLDWIRSNAFLSRTDQRKVKEGKMPQVCFHSLNAASNDEGDPFIANMAAADEGNAVDMADEVEAALRSVRKPDREILRAYFIDCLTMREVAEKFGLSESRISQRISAALQKQTAPKKETPMSEQNGRFSLKAMHEKTPPVNPVEAMRKQLAMGLYNGVKEDDIAAMAAKLKEMALRGDLKAMKMLFDLVLPSAKSEADEASAHAGLKLLAESIRDLTDESRIARADVPKKHRQIAHGPKDDDDDED